MIKADILPQIRINLKKFGSKVHILKRILLKIDRKNSAYSIMTFALSSAKILGNLTPFGTAFFASVCTAKNLVPAMTAMALGSLFAHVSATALCYVLVAALIATITIIRGEPLKTGLKALLTGSALFILKTFVTGTTIAYDMILNFIEAAVASLTVIAADRAIPVMTAANRRTVLSTEESISVVVLLAAAILSLNGLPQIFGLNLANILSIALVLVLNLNCTSPVGAVIGTVVGAVCCTTADNPGGVIGAYAFSALISSLFKTYGKIGIILGFILANSVITVFLSGSGEVFISTYEILAASVILFALPQSVTDTIAHISAISTADSVKSDSGKTSSIYQDRLSRIAESLSILSKNASVKSHDDIVRKEVASLITNTAQKACSDCSLRFCCWQKKSAETKKSVMQLLSAAQHRGKATTNDVSNELKSRCIRTENLLRSFNDSYEMYRTNLMWQKRLSDSKTLACVQMGSIANLLNEMSKENQTIADAPTKSLIRTALDGAGFVPENITAYFRDNGNLLIELKFPAAEYKDDMKHIIASCLTEALGVKFRFNDVLRDTNTITITYSMCERFCRSTGAASMKKHGESVCGDSFTTVNLPDGRFVAAISDGMGSGVNAASESRNTIELLKTFLHCGFDVIHALRLINSSLMMTGTEEIFSTVDLCSINMHTGVADFVKIGGASTYIKCGSNVEKLTSSSLPAGILEEINPKRFSRKIDEECLIIMVSDGIESASNDDTWLEKRLAVMDTINPHVIADKILELALYFNGGKAKDDMTVIATRVWEEK